MGIKIVKKKKAVESLFPLTKTKNPKISLGLMVAVAHS